MKTFINLEGSDYTPYGLSAAGVAGDLVFAAGMALDFEALGRSAEAETIADETRLCIEDVERILAEADCTLADIVKCNCYVTDDSYRAELYGAWDEAFAGIDPKPMRFVQVVGIGAGCRVEIAVVAVKPQADD